MVWWLVGLWLLSPALVPIFWRSGCSSRTDRLNVRVRPSTSSRDARQNRIAPLYRPQFLGHRLEPYAAAMTEGSCF
jgi:hypothetical protein